MRIQNNVKSKISLKVFTLFLMLAIPSHAFSAYDSGEVDYEKPYTDLFDEEKSNTSYKHYRNKRWSEHVSDARSHFRMRLRELFRYLRRIRVAINDPDTNWDDFDWKYKDKDHHHDHDSDDDKDDDDNPGDDAANDDSSDDDSVNDDTSGDDSANDDAPDDDRANDDISGDDSANDDASVDDSSDDDSVNDDTSGDDSANDDATDDDSGNDDTLDDDQDVGSPTQKISVSNQPTGLLGDNVEFEISYTTSNDNNQLSGLGLRVHFDSSILTFNSLSNVLQQDIIVSGEGPSNDVDDFDNNPQTDSYITFGWASLFNNWPNVELPSLLVKATFGVSSAVDLNTVSTTAVNFTSIASAAGYEFEAEDYALELAETESTWDFDGNGDADALTDGLIMLRYSFGLRGETMADKAMATNSQMSVSQVEERMLGAMAIADIDNDGDVDALTDGLLLLRHLFAVDDDQFTKGAVGIHASRKTKAAIKHHLNKHMPKKR
jgi:hypothetical protein